MLTRPPFTVSEFPVAGGPFYFTVGSDRAVWFTLSNTVGVGRVDPFDADSLRVIPLPGNVKVQYAIAAGADGNIWTTDYRAHQFVRIEPHAAYRVTSIPFPPVSAPLFTGGACPGDIVAGPDGNLWFNCIGASNIIGRLSPFGQHQVTLFAVPGAGFTAADITRGPWRDPESIWFIGASSTGTNVNIGRIGTRVPNELTLFPITPTGGPNAIGRGPDGNLWVTEGRTGYAIGRLRLGSHPAFTEFPLPDDVYARAPICGPDATEWFSTVPFGSTPAAQFEGRLALRDLSSSRADRGDFDDDNGCRSPLHFFDLQGHSPVAD
ncbi:MAG: hypothetical protein JO023_03690 [Chloroflexi bacterium]|nr:hypothetical protein [Chloroflexota bacterium]